MGRRIVGKKRKPARRKTSWWKVVDKWKWPSRKTVKLYAFIFFGGMLWDAILSVDQIVTAHLYEYGAALTTYSITMISFAMYDRIVARDGKGNMGRKQALAIGSMIGAYGATLIFRILGTN